MTDTSTVTVPATDTPSIGIVKTASVPNFSATGVVITYDYSVTNTGNEDLHAVSVTDAHPGLSPIICPETTLAPGESEICTATYTTTQADLDAGSVTNTGTASGTSPQDVVVTDDDTVTVPAVDAPAIAIAKTSVPASFDAAGQLITYSYEVTNGGNVTLHGITVTDPQSGLSAISCPGGQPFSLAPGASETCTATYTTKAGDVDAGGIDNTGTATGTSPQGTVVTDQSTLHVPATEIPVIVVAKSASPSTYDASGQVITYSYEVTNTGNVTLHDISVIDPLPGLSVLTCPSTTLASGASETCTATYTTTQADVDAGSVTNTGTATGTSPTGVIVTDSSTLTITAVQTPALTMVKTGSVPDFEQPGQTVTYSYKVTNTGNVTLHDVAVTDPHPNVSAISCPGGQPFSLAPGASTICTATYTTTQADVDAGKITNTATARGVSPNGTTETSDSTDVIPVAELTLAKTASLSKITAAGQHVTYSFLVTNIGNVSIINLTVTDPLAGLSAISCPTTTLAPGAATTCTATYTTTQADVDHGGVTNTGTADGDTSLDDVPVVPVHSTVTVPAERTPAVAIMKSASISSFTSAGTVVTYHFKVTNTGNVTLDSVTVTDTLPGLSAISCPDTTLAPGAIETCTATYTTTQADVDHGSIRNTATVTATPPPGLPQVTATSTVVIAGPSPVTPPKPAPVTPVTPVTIPVTG